jgi:hypothetical protein
MKKTLGFLVGSIGILVGAWLLFRPIADLQSPVLTQTPTSPVESVVLAPVVSNGEMEPNTVPEAGVDVVADVEDVEDAEVHAHEDDFIAGPLSEDGFDALPALGPVSQLSRTIADLQNSTLVTLDEYGRTMLLSTNAALRAIGGILMFKAQAMDEAVLRQLALDEDVAVPFLVLEWIRDYGASAMAQALAGMLAQRELDVEGLADDLLAGRLAMGGGRVAVDFLADHLPADARWEVLLEIAGTSDMAYDLRMRSILRLAGESDVSRFLDEMAALRDSTQEEGEDWAEALQRLAARLSNDEGTDLVARDTITARDLNLIIGNPYPNFVRDIALYLEDRLLTPDVQVEAGAADLIGRFVKEYPDQADEWNVEDEEVLQRIRALHERLVAMESMNDESS